MRMKYLPVDFKIRFAEPAVVDNLPIFVLRGLFGQNLRYLCCMNKGAQCQSCMFNKQCVYAVVFESIIDKQEAPIPGTDRVSHPFAFTSCDNPELWTEIQEFNFTITLFGNYTDYLAYVYTSILRAGKRGMFRDRIPFEIVEAGVNGNSILIDEDNLNLEQEAFVFDEEEIDKENLYTKAKINLLTPLRFKVDGKYAKDFTALDFMKCLHRRYQTMMKLYGEHNDEVFDRYLETNLTICNKEIKWNHKYRYSGRQKTSMEFGGVTGYFELEGQFTEYEKTLLEFCTIANGGKNTNFGLGQINVEFQE